MDYKRKSLQLHAEKRGKFEITPLVDIKTKNDLSIVYTPGVAEPCLEIKDNKEKSFELTRRWNTCLVVTDGSAVLGLGNIGASASMPVMEGKCVLFKKFGDVDAFPLCINSQNVDEIVSVIQLISDSFGGINLEDISAPRCFEIERRLQSCCNIPVFHDDQHGTAVVVLAGLINALKLVHKEKESVSVVINGAGAAAISICKLLLIYGYKNITLCDRTGAIFEGRQVGMNPEKEIIAKQTNLQQRAGTLTQVIKGADIFIGVSSPGVLTPAMIGDMNDNAIIFACANPTPEIFPDEAYKAGATVVATGRSDFDNQINNVLAFPGIFRGAFDCRAKEINDEMKLAAAEAIAGLVSDEQLASHYIIPDVLDSRVASSVAKSVCCAAKATGVARYLHE